MGLPGGGQNFLIFWSVLEVGQNQSNLEGSGSDQGEPRATVARVNGLLNVHMEAPDIEIDEKVYTEGSGSSFLCGYGSWRRRHLWSRCGSLKTGAFLER